MLQTVAAILIVLVEVLRGAGYLVEEGVVRLISGNFRVVWWGVRAWCRADKGRCGGCVHHRGQGLRGLRDGAGRADVAHRGGDGRVQTGCCAGGH